MPHCSRASFVSRDIGSTASDARLEHRKSAWRCSSNEELSSSQEILAGPPASRTVCPTAIPSSP